MDFPKQKITLNNLAKTLMVDIKRGDDIDQVEGHLYEIMSHSRRSIISIVNSLEDESYQRQFKTLLGFCYYRGIGVDVDCDKAVECFEIAADNNHSYAFFFLGHFYERGISVNQDFQKALDCYTEAAERQNAAAAYRLAQCYLDGGLSVDEDSHKGFHWAKKAALSGHLFGKTKLAKCYEDGIGTKVNLVGAVKWYQKAARDEDSEAQLALGLMYEDGRLKQDYQTAFDYFLKSAVNGNSEAQYKVALCYKSGQGTRKIPLEYRKWIKAAVESGNDEAGEHLAQFQTRYSHRYSTI